MSDEEVLQKVVKLRAVGLNTTAAEDHKALYVQLDVDRERLFTQINVNFLVKILLYSVTGSFLPSLTILHFLYYNKKDFFMEIYNETSLIHSKVYKHLTVVHRFH